MASRPRVLKKSFDCVAMKDEIQAALLAEYRAQRDTYPSFVEFVKARAAKSPWVQSMRRKHRMASAA